MTSSWPDSEYTAIVPTQTQAHYAISRHVGELAGMGTARLVHDAGAELMVNVNDEYGLEFIVQFFGGYVASEVMGAVAPSIADQAPLCVDIIGHDLFALVRDSLRARSLGMGEENEMYLAFRSADGNGILVRTNNIDVVLLPSNEDECLRFAARIIRYILHNQMESVGWVPFHASALGMPESHVGVCFTGRKFSGKTATLLSLLSSMDGQYISNDKILLHSSVQESAMVAALPRSVPVRRDVVNVFPKISQKFSEESAEKVIFSPQEIADNFSRKILPSTKLGAVVAVEYAPGIRQNWVRLRDEDALEILERNTLPLRFTGPAAVASGQEKTTQYRDALQRIADMVPVVAWNRNENLVETLEVFDRLTLLWE